LSIRTLKKGDEKESAFRGFCMMMPHNVKAIINHFPYVCNAFVLYSDAPPELEAIFREVVHKVRESLGGLWESNTAEFPADLRQGLSARFGV
jgi:transportin-1